MHEMKTIEILIHDKEKKQKGVNKLRIAKT